MLTRIGAGLLALALALAAGCGDDGTAAPTPDAPSGDTRDIALRLADLPGVTVTEMPLVHAPAGYRYFVLQVTQPVDHDDPASATFQQEVSLIHRDVSAPMVASTTGYDDYSLDYPSEPALIVSGNQISIEHRFFGTSRPDPADWSKLTIKQMADDEHAIIVLLKSIYAAPWISTGGSKGGMTASYHHRFYPDDVRGTVAYVAPLSFSVPDPRYATFLAATGEPDCAAAVRAAAKEMLQNRRAALLTRATTQAASESLAYTRIAIGPALESAILDLEWSYWQYFGVSSCNIVPAITATDAQMFTFLDEVSPVGFSADPETAEFDAYFYQAYAQLGSPGTVGIRGDLVSQDFTGLTQYTDADFGGSFPVGVPIPAHDAAPMQDIDDWIQHDAAHFVFLYGEWDPWSGGAYHLGAATDALEVTAMRGTHDSGVLGLSVLDREAVLGKLEAWTGVQPKLPPGARPAVLDARRHRHGPAR